MSNQVRPFNYTDYIIQFKVFYSKNMHQQRALMVFLYLNLYNMFQPNQGPLYDFTIRNKKLNIPIIQFDMYQMENVPFRPYFILTIILITH